MDQRRLEALVKSISARRSQLQGYGVFAKRGFVAGQKISYFEGYEVDHPTAYSLTLEGKRIEPTGELKHLNHSCAPNSHFEGRWLVASRNINAVEELTIDYTRTEAGISHPFQCRCTAANCKGYIGGISGRRKQASS